MPLTSQLQTKLNKIQELSRSPAPWSTKREILASILEGMPASKVQGKLLTSHPDTTTYPKNEFVKVLQNRSIEKDSSGVQAYHNVQLYGLEWEFEMSGKTLGGDNMVGRNLLSKVLINACGVDGAEHKGDGSLSSEWGREINLKPATYHQLKDMLTRIKLSKFEQHINVNQTKKKAGIHIHLDKYTMSTAGYIKLWGLINHNENIPFWRVFGRRYERGEGDNSYRYCKWNPCTSNDLIGWLKRPTTFAKIVDKGHYSAISYTNKDTFEIRMFNGAPNVDTVLEYVEAVASMCDWTHNSGVLEYSVSSWVQFLLKNKHTYPHAYKRMLETQRLFELHFSSKHKTELPEDVFSTVSVQSPF